MKIIRKDYRLVIGLTGPIASGKGMIAKTIQESFAETEGVSVVLLSDFIRDLVRADGKPITRDTLRAEGTRLREQNGPGALAQIMLEKLPENQSGILLVDSIRNPGEIEVLKDTFGERVFVIATDAPLADRVTRVLQRGREDDSSATEEIARQMQIEMEDRPDTGFALERCRKMADVVSVGRESKAERAAEVREALRRFLEQRDARESRQETKHIIC